MKKKEPKRRCRVYFLPISKYLYFRITIWPGGERMTVYKVKFNKAGDEMQTIARWDAVCAARRPTV